MAKLIYMLFLLYYLPFQSVQADDIIKEQTLSTSQGKTLIVKSIAGDVNISTWSKDEAYIKITGNNNAKENIDFNIEEKNGDIYVTLKCESKSKVMKDISLKVDVSIPSKFNTKISTAGGNIVLTDLTGTAEMKTAGGDIELKNINGKAELKTAGGNIKVESFKGDFEAKTAGGDINISGSEGKIEAKTAGGNVTLKYTGENKGMELSTAGGDVNLYLPDNFAANLDLKTMSGDIRIDFDYTNESDKQKKDKIKGKINGGGELISCKTMGGNIVIEKIK